MSGPVTRTPAQRLAADPARHVWVTASAGTGKTHVLTDRLLRLMLAGSAPERLLALTFTRAAANEMQNRLTGRLGRWQTLADAALDAELDALGAATGPAARQRARSLFALALDVPGGLKVQTIHAFAQGLLAAFPLEAGLPPGFTALEERDQRQLRQRALNEAIADAQAAGDRSFLADLAELSVLKGEGGVMQLVDRMIAHTEGLLAFTSGTAIELAVRRHLGIAPEAQPGDALRQALHPAVHDDARLEDYAAAMTGWGAKTGHAYAAEVRQWLALDTAQRAAAFEPLRKLFVTGEGEPRKEPHAVRAAPRLRGLIDDIAADLNHLAEREARVETALLAGRALRAGHRIADRYARLKRARTAIDYDDMIRETAALLGRPGLPNYVGWKLDSRFDHVLVDEAQDTNARQWAIVASLVQDYFDRAPETESERQRSLFVVGDQKQAIYGFQGTDPSLFQGEFARLQPGAERSGRPIQQVPLDLSFRSGPAVLDVVNAFLADAGPQAVGLAAAPPPHVPNRRDAPGEVLLWPVLTPGGEADDEDETEDGSEAADRLMAERLAAQIRAWTTPGAEQLWLPARERFVRYEDILILLRKRSWLMGALVGRLHAEKVPVAGVDRLLLTEPYAVLDLLALVRFAVQPEDDLNLAGLLVSPFLGWTHEAVRALAGPRPADLWAALGHAAQGDGPAADARAFLNAVLALADRGGPYLFLDTILSGPLAGRRRLLARLGPEANDAIDELLSQALAFERLHPPALAGFLAWVEAEGSEVKRDAEASAGQVRLMTVHGAKGLEAPIVVLADTAHRRKANSDGFIAARLDNSPAEVPLFHPSVKTMPAALRAAHEAKVAREAEEDLRLLYVGLTRAADHLYIGGALGARAHAAYVKGDADHSWHRRLAALMPGIEGVETIDTGWGETLRLRRGAWTSPTAAEPVLQPDSPRQDIFDVELTEAPPPGRPTRPLTPSALPDAATAGPATAELKAASTRGRLLHRLFERLPSVAPARRAEVAAAWLKAQGAPADGIDALVGEALAVIEAPANAALFAPDALAEASLAGLVGTTVVSGVVDRLLVTDELVTVVDFKTGLRVPVDAAAAPLPHKRQMALYRALLQRAFAGRPVEAALLYTAAPKFILLDGKELDALAALD
jgi:ATP-dependent helicase/nuclease subunit A